MVHVSELTALTGYVRGGCSPIGMKKHYLTVLDESARELETVVVSAGRIGAQVELSLEDLISFCDARTADLTTED